MKDMRKIFAVLAAVVLLTGCQETMDERCAREAREYTEKKCPVQVTTGVMMDSLVYEASTRTLVYYYTVEGVLDDAEALRTHNLRGMLLKELRNSANMKDYKEAGYNFRYVYWSTKENGAQLFETTFRQKDYQ
jgi:PBP1b-binding outer membrane lipoprotein LpoB